MNHGWMYWNRLPLHIPPKPNHFAVDFDLCRICFDGFVVGVVAEDVEFVLVEEDLDPFDHDPLVDGDGVDAALGGYRGAGMVDQDKVAGE